MHGKGGYWNNKNVRSGGEANGGKPTYKAKWIQEVETHIKGRASYMLKQDERNMFFRDARWSLDSETNEDTCENMLWGAGGRFGTKWMQEAAERHRAGGTLDACKKLWRGDQGTRYEAKWMQEVAKSTG